MRVAMVSPAPVGSRLGNRVTAVRWKKLLGEIGHQVSISAALPRGRYDVLLALPARAVGPEPGLELVQALHRGPVHHLPGDA